MTGTAIYVRVSSAKDKDDTTLDAQEKDCRALAAKLGLTIKEVYSEGVLSGAELENRPQMMRLLDDIKRRKISTAIAFTWSRMSRDEWDGLEIVGLSQRYGCRWRFVNSPIPAGMEDSPEALILYAIESTRAGGERKSIKLHTGRGAEERILRGGKRNGSKPPYGWLKVDLKKGPDGKKRPGWTVKPDKENTAPVVYEMYHRMAAGSSIRQVVKWLQGSDHETPMRKDPGRWSDTAVKYILSDPIHYGRVVTDRLKRVPGTKSSVLRPESEWRDIPNAEPVEPIVDEATWRGD